MINMLANRSLGGYKKMDYSPALINWNQGFNSFQLIVGCVCFLILSLILAFIMINIDKIIRKIKRRI